MWDVADAPYFSNQSVGGQYILFSMLHALCFISYALCLLADKAGTLGNVLDFKLRAFALSFELFTG